jgi:16S rRNA (cytosine967-C5)-methyltransferase
VEHAKSDPRTARFSGLVNGVLRALARVKDRALPAALVQTIDAPNWFQERLIAAYGPETAAAIHTMHRRESPIDFTVKDDPEGWARAFGGVVLPTGSVRVARLDRAVNELPGYAEGEWWVQDAAAALPARLFGTVIGKHIADLCAAPGGKTAQLALAGADVTALDQSGSRIKRLSANLDRLRLHAAVVQGDAAHWRPERLFDGVLVDAPCSSTGTVRRHPDVPWTKSVEDVRKLAGVQARLLDHAITLTKPGGLVVFSNCSLDPIEGEEMVSVLLARRDDVVADPISPNEFPGLAPFVDGSGRLRTTPADLDFGRPELAGLDGFFAARLRKTAR